MSSPPPPRQPPSPFGSDLPAWPQVDFAAYGPVESQALSRTQKLVAGFMARNWVMIPHVTHHDEADITQLEATRKRLSAEQGIKLTPLPFLVKAAVAALRLHPGFNASLDGTGANLMLKKYFNIGIAIDTPGGLLVPVIRQADQKDLKEIAMEISEVSELARTKGLPFDRMSGGCFTISSLGSIGGTAFTPIINAPEVAIMGVSKNHERPVKVDGQLEWRTMLPLSLSYDHRVINGAAAARFCVDFARALADLSVG